MFLFSVSFFSFFHCSFVLFFLYVVWQFMAGCFWLLQIFDCHYLMVELDDGGNTNTPDNTNSVGNIGRAYSNNIYMANNCGRHESKDAYQQAFAQGFAKGQGHQDNELEFYTKHHIQDSNRNNRSNRSNCGNRTHQGKLQ